MVKKTRGIGETFKQTMFLKTFKSFHYFFSPALNDSIKDLLHVASMWLWGYNLLYSRRVAHCCAIFFVIWVVKYMIYIIYVKATSFWQSVPKQWRSLSSAKRKWRVEMMCYEIWSSSIFYYVQTVRIPFWLDFDSEIVPKVQMLLWSKEICQKCTKTI